MAGSPTTNETLNQMREAHSEFLQELQNDISRSRSIDAKWKKAYIGSCHRIRNKMYEFQFKFIEETLAKINTALTLPENNPERNDIYVTFQMVFDEIAVRCTLVDNEMKTILKTLTDQDPSLAKKYLVYTGIGIGTFLVGSALATTLILHAVPATVCTFIIGAPVAVPLIIVGAVVCSVIAITMLWKASSTKDEQRAHTNIRNWAALSFPTFAELGLHDQCSDKEIEEKFHKILCAMTADADVWKSNVKLKTLKKSLEDNAQKLRNDKKRVEQQDAALAN